MILLLRYKALQEIYTRMLGLPLIQGLGWLIFALLELWGMHISKASNERSKDQAALCEIALISSFLRGMLVAAVNALLANSKRGELALGAESAIGLLAIEAGVAAAATVLR